LLPYRFGDFVDKDLRFESTSYTDNLRETLSWRVYPPEFILSEKLQTLVERADANSRAKDVYDLVWLFQKCEDQSKLMRAIEKTFERRRTQVPDSWKYFCESLDVQVLKASWRSVQMSGIDQSFDDCWGDLRSYLEAL